MDVDDGSDQALDFLSLWAFLKSIYAYAIRNEIWFAGPNIDVCLFSVIIGHISSFSSVFIFFCGKVFCVPFTV